MWRVSWVKGSNFQFIYPCKPLKKKAKEYNMAAQEYEFSKLDINILVVEDNKLNQFVASQFLNKWGARVDIANNGLEALHLLAKKKYHIVLMDIQMPEMNGLDASKQIRKKNTVVLQRDIPIIALTANAFQDTKREIFLAGMNAFVSKPLIPKDLHLNIKNLI